MKKIKKPYYLGSTEKWPLEIDWGMGCLTMISSMLESLLPHLLWKQDEAFHLLFCVIPGEKELWLVDELCSQLITMATIWKELLQPDPLTTDDRGRLSVCSVTFSSLSSSPTSSSNSSVSGGHCSWERGSRVLCCAHFFLISAWKSADHNEMNRTQAHKKKLQINPQL